MTTEKRAKRTADELPRAHATMFRVLQSKTLPANARGKKIITKIHADGQVYALESYRDPNNQIGHSITTSTEESGAPTPVTPTSAKLGT
jgi:hypothetical protein